MYSEEVIKEIVYDKHLSLDHLLDTVVEENEKEVVCKNFMNTIEKYLKENKVPDGYESLSDAVYEIAKSNYFKEWFKKERTGKEIQEDKIYILLPFLKDELYNEYFEDLKEGYKIGLIYAYFKNFDKDLDKLPRQISSYVSNLLKKYKLLSLFFQRVDLDDLMVNALLVRKDNLLFDNMSDVLNENVYDLIYNAIDSHDLREKYLEKLIDDNRINKIKIKREDGPFVIKKIISSDIENKKELLEQLIKQRQLKGLDVPREFYELLGVTEETFLFSPTGFSKYYNSLNRKELKVVNNRLVDILNKVDIKPSWGSKYNLKLKRIAGKSKYMKMINDKGLKNLEQLGYSDYVEKMKNIRKFTAMASTMGVAYSSAILIYNYANELVKQDPMSTFGGTMIGASIGLFSLGLLSTIKLIEYKMKM